MRLKAVVKYLDALAHYVVRRIRPGIYEAKLERYEGSPETDPPGDILMVRSVGHWSGNIDDKDLTDKIGYALDENARKGDILDQR